MCAGAALVLGWKEVRGLDLETEQFTADALYHQMVEVYLAAINELFSIPDHHWHEIPLWNDQPERGKQEEVIDATRAGPEDRRRRRREEPPHHVRREPREALVAGDVIGVAV